MGHAGKLFNPHDALRRRLDRYMIGAPEGRGIGEILTILFDADEAAIGARMPCKPSTLARIARRCAMEVPEVRRKLQQLKKKMVGL